MILSIFLYILVGVFSVTKDIEEHGDEPIDKWEKLDIGASALFWPLVMLYEVTVYWLGRLRKKIGGE